MYSEYFQISIEISNHVCKIPGTVSDLTLGLNPPACHEYG